MFSNDVVGKVFGAFSVICIVMLASSVWSWYSGSTVDVKLVKWDSIGYYFEKVDNSAANKDPVMCYRSEQENIKFLKAYRGTIYKARLNNITSLNCNLTDESIITIEQHLTEARAWH